MSDVRPPDDAARFALTPRQRRLRVVTLTVLVLVGAMIAVGVRAPFFRSAGSPAIRALAREALVARREDRPVRPAAVRASRAVRVRLIAIYLYWTCCILLTTSLFVLAWLDMREVQRKLARARRDIWRVIAEEHRRRRPES